VWGPSPLKKRGKRANRGIGGMRKEKRKEGNDLEGGSKKRQRVANDNSLDSMFAKQQAVSAFNKARDAYNTELQKGKEIGLDEAAQAEPVRRSEKDTHDIQGTETVHAIVQNVSKSSAGVTRPSSSAQGRSHVYSELSGLEDVVFNDFIRDDFIPECGG